MLQVIHRKGAASSGEPDHESRPELFRIYAEQSSNLAADESRHVLNGYLAYLENEMRSQNGTADIGKIQEMLLEVSQFILSGKARISGDLYQCVLRRLTVIYAPGLALAGQNAYTLTASDYADVIESLSRVYPLYDYSEIVGQLIHYLNQLFALRDSHWKTVYEHIVCMPESIEAIKFLKNQHFFEVQQWAEEGVENLFHIQDDIQQRVRRLDDDIRDIARSMTVKQRLLGVRERGFAASGASNLVDLKARHIADEIEILRQSQDRLIREREGKAYIAELIESNILEFEEKLKDTRRSFSVRLVYAAD